MSSAESQYQPHQTRHSVWLLAYLMATAMISGALVMVVEVLGSRVIGPFFGVSLFIWTSLIAVTLIALSLGYAFGGHLADKRGDASYLYGIILLAGLAVLLIPFLKGPVLQLCVPLGLRLGTFLSTTLLFGPPLFLLGCVSPYLIKIAANELDNIGRTVGGFYAVSTVGSVIGTVVTGFVLIAYMSVDDIFFLVGALLILLALSYFIVIQRIWKLAPLLLLPLILTMLNQQEKPVVTLANGTQAALIASHDSYYGSLKVVEYSYEQNRTRELIIDGLIQGAVDVNSGESVYSYSYFMSMLPFAMKGDLQNALVIGMGAGLVPRWFEKRGVTTDVVDIDPRVFDFAHDYFGVKVSGREFAQDARYFLQSSQDKYDVVVLDVFNGDTTPAHLLSVEALKLASDRLSNQGILAVNLVGSLYQDNYMTASIIKTLKEVFDQVEVYPTSDSVFRDGRGNLAVMAYQGELLVPDLSRVNNFSVSKYARQEVYANLGRKLSVPADAPAIVLTDQYNPVDFFDAELREGVRKTILRETDWNILIYSG